MAAMTRSPGQALAEKIGLVTPALHAAMAGYWLSGDPEQRYVDYLQTMHTLLRASVPLMEHAALRCSATASADPVAAPLRAYLLEHADEERHHDEWIAGDLLAAGRDPGPLLAAQPAAAVAALAGAQYYWVNHHHPACLLGYIAVLEGHAPMPGLAAALQARTALPREAFRTLLHHAEADGGHAARIHEVVDALPLTAAQTGAIGVSALHTAAGLTELFAGRAPCPSRPPNQPRGGGHGNA
jgi:hypothetical protein